MITVSKLVWFGVFLILSAFVNGLSFWYDIGNSKAFDLTNENFFEHIGKENKYYVVKFFTKGCYFCKKMHAEYDKLAEHYSKRGDVVIARIECGDNDEVAMQYGITMYPQVKMFGPGSTKILSKFPSDAPRKLDKFVQWVDKYIPKTELKVEPAKTEISRLAENKLNVNNNNNVNTANTGVNNNVSGGFMDNGPNVATQKVQNPVIDNSGQSKEFEFLKREFISIRNKISYLEEQIKFLKGGNAQTGQTGQNAETSTHTKTPTPTYSNSSKDHGMSFQFLLTVMFFFTCSIAGLMTVRKIYLKTSMKDN
jgi:thiol-disulfide isomerase/thioredoxin